MPCYCHQKVRTVSFIWQGLAWDVIRERKMPLKENQTEICAKTANTRVKVQVKIGKLVKPKFEAKSAGFKLHLSY